MEAFRRRRASTSCGAQTRQNRFPDLRFYTIRPSLFRNHGQWHAAGDIPRYKYTKLQKNQIRLLKLHYSASRLSGAGYDTALLGELVTVPIGFDDEGSRDNVPTHRTRSPTPASSCSHDLLDDIPETPKYEAISYVWGGEDVHASQGRPFICILLASGDGTKSNQRDRGYLAITPNLEAALEMFCSKMQPTEDLYLWIDAICMDQNSDEEKAHQIRMMADIYMQAECVRIWLGNDDKERHGQVAFNFIREILRFNLLDKIVVEPEHSHRWAAFRYLMQNSWFKRRWIVQEISFARKAKVYLGGDVMNWDDLKGAISLFAEASDNLRQMFQKSEAYSNNPEYLGEVKALGAKRLVDVTKLMFRKSSDGWIMENLLSLESLLTTLTPFDAKLAHDSVYAILRLSNNARPGVKSQESGAAHHGRVLIPPAGWEGKNLVAKDGITASGQPSGIVKDTDNPELSPTGLYLSAAGDDSGRGRPQDRSDANRHRNLSPAVARREAEGKFRRAMREFVVDYDRSMLSLCREIYSFIVEESFSIDIICRPWIPSINTNNRRTHEEDRHMMPSWIQPESKRPFGIWSGSVDGQRYQRLAAEPLVGMMPLAFKSYSASGVKPIPPRFIPGQTHNGVLIEGRLLNTCGFVLDKIGEKADPALNATIPKDWIRFAKQRDESEDLPQVFWRTLVANRKSSEGPELPPDHWPHACKWAFSQGPHRKGNLPIDSLLGGVFDKPSELARPFLHRVREVVWDRRLFWTQENPRLGLAPQEVEKDDLICILYGCSVPVLLRPYHLSADVGADRGRARRIDKRQRYGGASRSAKRQRYSRPSSSQPCDTATQRADSHGHNRGNPDIIVSETVDGPSEMDTLMANAAPGSSDGDQIDDTRPASSLPPHKNQTLPIVTPATLPSSPFRKVYSFIGECYLDGMMDGEAFQQKEEHNLVEEDFQLGCMVECDCKDCCRSNDERQAIDPHVGYRPSDSIPGNESAVTAFD